jgi:hypothetical protein
MDTSAKVLPVNQGLFLGELDEDWVKNVWSRKLKQSMAEELGILAPATT